MLSDCKTLDDYLKFYGAALGARAAEALDPLHVPGRDPEPPGLEAIDRHVHRKRNSRIFRAQRDVLAAIDAAWRRKKSLILSAEPGSGKSLISAAACHLRARGRPYRALVMCPDHLLKKWEREIEDTVPGARVTIFRSWKDVLALAHGQRERAPVVGGDWFVLGRDRSKFDPPWKPAIGRRYQQVLEPAVIRKQRLKGVDPRDLAIPAAVCPTCGTPVTDKDGNPIRPDEIPPKRKTWCQGTIARWEVRGDDVVEVLTPCNAPLWEFAGPSFKSAYRRWAPNRIINKKMKRFFDYLILDEVHELKDQSRAQAQSGGRLAAAAKKVIAMTGTLTGGQADHLFPTLMRLDAAPLVAAGFEWGGVTKFNQLYGKIETIETTIHSKSKGDDYREDNKWSTGSSTRRSQRVRPGIMPQLFGDFLIDRTVFLRLEELSEAMPALFEEMMPVLPDEEVADAYKELSEWLRVVVKQMIVTGDKRLLGTMLSALLSYPDYPYDWKPIDAGEHGSYQPRNLDPTVIRPKEEALLDIVHREKNAGRQVWVYIQMTRTRDVGSRLVRLAIDSGLKAAYLESDGPDREDREDWIYKNARGVDLMVSHPKLVETGFDLFSRSGNHNFPTLVFYH